MRRWTLCLASVSAASAAVTGAAAQGFNVACVKGADNRTIEILSPGEIGAVCDVRYGRNAGATVRTPYHANNSADFCQAKATEIVGELIAEGFACGQVGGALTAEARPAPSPQAQTPAPVQATPTPAPEQSAPAAQTAPRAETIEAAAAEPAPEPAITLTSPDATYYDIQEAAAATEPEAAPEPQPTPVAVAATAAPEPVDPSPNNLAPEVDASAAATDAAAAIEQTTLDALPEPTAHAGATGGPATLAGEGLETPVRAAAPIPAGRLVGAEPQEPAPQPVAQQTAPAQTAPVQTAAVQTAMAPAEPNTQPKKIESPASQAASPKKTIKIDRMRGPEDIVLATLNAQVAAWNEGNLNAFMETYWKDEDLKFVSNSGTYRGWNATMRRYRDQYADESGLGKLSLEKTGIEMVTDDVAVASGRYNLAKGDEATSGFFTLVMKRQGGVWRIVHDHSAADAANAQ